MKNLTKRTNRIMIIFAVIGFTLFIIGCPRPAPNSPPNNSNQNNVNVVKTEESLRGGTCQPPNCECDGQCSTICPCPSPTPRITTGSNGNSNSNTNGNANVR